MKKILIISYHALPMDVVSSYRTKAYCEYLYGFGFFPTLITHRWEKDEKGNWKVHDKGDQVITEENDSHNVIRLPRPCCFKAPNDFSSKVFTAKSWIQGDLDIELRNSYFIFKDFLFDHLKSNKYDVCLAIFSPHYHLKLAFEINKKFRLPYVLDFRDLWDNQIVTSAYTPPNLKKKLIDLVNRYWWKKWLGNAMFFSVAGKKWKIYIESFSGKSGLVIRNGFEFIVENSVKDYQSPGNFKIVHFGKLYENQDLEVFLNGFNRFLDKTPSKQAITLELIGWKSSNNEKLKSLIYRHVPEKNLNIIDYMAKDELLQYCKKNASVFYFPGFKEDNGSFAVKVFDYISLQKPVIMSPGDKSEVESILNETQAGIILNTPEEVDEFLVQKYKEFSRGSILFGGKLDKILQYQRGHQVEKLALNIHRYLDNEKAVN